MRRLRILALLHRELVPPDSVAGLGETQMLPFRQELDVLAGLRRLGHEVRVAAVGDELGTIQSALLEFQPDLTFNLLLYFHDAGVYDSAIVACLELLKVPYTGCNPRGLMLAGDKALSKKVLAWHDVRAPRFALFPRGRSVRAVPKLRFPLFVKSASEHASTGISRASIVPDPDALVERVAFVHEKVGTDAIAEEYVEGRELTVGVLGNRRPTAFPVWEWFFDRLPAGVPRIATSRVKWDRAYQRRIGLRTGPAELTPAEAAAVQREAKRTYQALELTGYARIDFRLDDDGALWVLEANPNPDLCQDEDFAVSARTAGLDYDALLGRILSLGLAHEPAWKG